MASSSIFWPTPAEAARGPRGRLSKKWKKDSLTDEAVAARMEFGTPPAHEKLDDLREERRAIVATGQPGCGETHRANLLIHYTCEKGGKVLFTFPTGQMQSRLRAELQREGIQVDVDTCHGALALHQRERTAGHR